MRLPSSTVVILAALFGCGPKEARDPAEILAEDPAFLPQEDPEGPPDPASAQKEPPRLATRRQCEDAMRHLEQLGFDIAIAEAKTPAERAELKQKRSEVMNSAAVRDRIRRSSDDCFARETPAKEVECVIGVRNQAELENCTQ